MEAKQSKMGLRLANSEIAKLRAIAKATNCTLSEAVRLLVRSAVVVGKPTAPDVQQDGNSNQVSKAVSAR
jgi:hypothetical protein